MKNFPPELKIYINTNYRQRANLKSLQLRETIIVEGKIGADSTLKTPST
ncbi:TPA: hypothetical protein IAD52_05975 [Candidatus Spyradomonas excrementavium]|nr:hypothetical protein [Candidatus Spyradomonas excrementavium]